MPSRGGDGGGAVGLRATSSNTHRITSSSTHPRASEIGYLREDGARRPSSYYDIPCLSRLVIRITASQTKVGRWPPCHVLQHPLHHVFLHPSLHVLQHPQLHILHDKKITINTKRGIIKQEKGLKTLNCVNCFGALHINTYLCTAFENTHAEIAQLVEHNLAKVGVAGSSPVFRSRNIFLCSFQTQRLPQWWNW